MKKIINIFLILILVTTLVTGCTNTNGQDDIQKDQEKVEENKKAEEEIEVSTSISDYFPFKENTLYSYKGEGNEYAEMKTYFEYISDDRAQLKTMNPGTNMGTILEYKDGELREIYSEGEVYYTENLLDIVEKPESYEVVLKEPLKVGSTWELKDGKKRTITGFNVEVETPYKKLKALEVTTELGNNIKQLEYYVQGIGLVASIYKDGDYEVKTLLEDLKEDYGLNYGVRFYYPTSTDLNIAYTNIDIKFRTNDKVEELIERTFKNPPSSKVVSPISPSTKINSIVFDKDKGIVRIDFSKELIEDMNVGSTQETQILNSIVNTFGSYYGVNKVYISTDGNPYSSGHYAIRENEYFTTDDTNIVELK